MINDGELFMELPKPQCPHSHLTPSNNYKTDRTSIYLKTTFLPNGYSLIPDFLGAIRLE